VPWRIVEAVCAPRTHRDDVRLRPERERDNSDAVAATVCTRAGRDHDPVEDAVAKLVLEPVEMLDVIAEMSRANFTSTATTPPSARSGSSRSGHRAAADARSDRARSGAVSTVCVTCT